MFRSRGQEGLSLGGMEGVEGGWSLARKTQRQYRIAMETAGGALYVTVILIDVGKILPSCSKLLCTKFVIFSSILPCNVKRTIVDVDTILPQHNFIKYSANTSK